MSACHAFALGLVLGREALLLGLSLGALSGVALPMRDGEPRGDGLGAGSRLVTLTTQARRNKFYSRQLPLRLGGFLLESLSVGNDTPSGLV